MSSRHENAKGAHPAVAGGGHTCSDVTSELEIHFSGPSGDKFVVRCDFTVHGDTDRCDLPDAFVSRFRVESRDSIDPILNLEIATALFRKLAAVSDRELRIAESLHVDMLVESLSRGDHAL
jgi:hypothetical protein